jgi:Ca2+-binding RTX toxin-like protein
VDFRLVSEYPGVRTRYYDSLDQAAREAGFSRIFGGIHFNFDNVEALKSGRGIGSLVSSSLMQRQTDVVAQVNGSELYIQGTTYNDNIFVTRSGSDLVVRNHGQLVGRFANAGLWSVVVNGSLGDDRIDFTQSVRTNTVVFGGNGNDRIFGSGGQNWIYGENGNDVLFGGRDADTIHGGYGDDWLHGLAGDDFLDGNSGIDWQYGGTGNDTLRGLRVDTVEIDHLFGGAGNDTLDWVDLVLN